MLRAVSRLLRTSPRIALVGEAVTFGQAVQLADELEPHVIVLDLHMAPRVNADAFPFNTEDSRPRLIAITAADVEDDASLVLAKAIGADRLLDKMSLEEELIPAILRLASS